MTGVRGVKAELSAIENVIPSTKPTIGMLTGRGDCPGAIPPAVFNAALVAFLREAALPPA
jgi:hypothetical protein